MQHLLSQRDNTPENDRENDWDRWFAIPGDIDDFIYYGEPQKYESER